MKNIVQYIKESDSKNGEWVEYADPDTGEVVTVWKEIFDADKEIEKLNKAKEDGTDFDSLMKKEKELRKQLDPLEDELFGYEEELKDTKREYRDLQIDHEEEVGALYADGKYEEGEKLAQEYGVKFNKLEKRIKVLQNKIKKLEPKIDKISSQIYALWQE